MKKTAWVTVLLIAVGLLTVGCATQNTAALADSFTVSPIYGSHMVLQREKPIRIVGFADVGRAVRVTFAGKTVTAVADADGKWRAQFSAKKAGGPYEVRVEGAEGGTAPVVFDDVMIGDVWLCSGQSNMEMPVWHKTYKFYRSKNGDKEAEASANPNIRLFFTNREFDLNGEHREIKGKWEVAEPEAIKAFSALGFYVARELQKDQQIPIGMVGAYWGGTRIEPWISAEGYLNSPFDEIADAIRTFRKLGHYQMTDREKEVFKRENEPLLRWFGVFRATPVAPETAAALKGWMASGYDDSKWASITPPQRFPGEDVGSVVMRLEVDVPEAWAGKDLHLNLGAIDDCDETFFNGEKIGETLPDIPMHWEVPRQYTVPGRLVKAGKNTIAIRVLNLYGSAGPISPASFLKLWADGTDVQPISLAVPWKYTTEFLTDVKRIGKRPTVYMPTMDPNRKQNFPTALFNAMLAPWTDYTLRGFLWYQGCSNITQPHRYADMQRTLIRDWRNRWGDDTLPFVFVQISAFYQHTPFKRLNNDFWKAIPANEPCNRAELREAQAETLDMPYTGMAVTIDIGDHSDIHPADKQTAALRVTAEVERLAYNRKGITSGPVFKEMEQLGHTLRLHFSNIGGGLVSKNGDELGCFAVAGADGKYVWAKAVIDGDTVVIWSDAVAVPMNVRYAWADFPGEPNLYNKEGFPAVPFRTK